MSTLQRYSVQFIPRDVDTSSGLGTILDRAWRDFEAHTPALALAQALEQAPTLALGPMRRVSVYPGDCGESYGDPLAKWEAD